MNNLLSSAPGALFLAVGWVLTSAAASAAAAPGEPTESPTGGTFAIHSRPMVGSGSSFTQSSAAPTILRMPPRPWPGFGDFPHIQWVDSIFPDYIIGRSVMILSGVVFSNGELSFSGDNRLPAPAAGSRPLVTPNPFSFGATLAELFWVPETDDGSEFLSLIAEVDTTVGGGDSGVWIEQPIVEADPASFAAIPEPAAFGQLLALATWLAATGRRSSWRRLARARE